MALSQMLKKKMINQTVRLSTVLARCFPNFMANQFQNPIFIIGCGRGGTTLLAALLGEHPDVAHWSEANQIWDPHWYPWRPANRDKPPLEFDPTGFTARWWRETQPRQKEIRATFGAYQWLWRKPHFLNKSPFNTFRIPYLLQMFPQARFIHLIRDGRAVVYSYARKLRAQNKLQQWPEPQQSLFSETPGELEVWLAAFWKANLAEVDQQNQVLELGERGILLEVTYEALCVDTLATLNRVCQFVRLDTPHLAASLPPARLENQNHKWQAHLEAGLVDRMAAAMEPMLTQWGYR